MSNDRPSDEPNDEPRGLGCTGVVMRRGFRALHRADGRWQYKIGKRYVILISPDCRRINVACQDVAGVGDWERARWKGYDQITPSRINKWLDAA